MLGVKKVRAFQKPVAGQNLVESAGSSEDGGVIANSANQAGSAE
jgi:hypothetical protein